MVYSVPHQIATGSNTITHQAYPCRSSYFCTSFSLKVPPILNCELQLSELIMEIVGVPIIDL